MTRVSKLFCTAHNLGAGHVPVLRTALVERFFPPPLSISWHRRPNTTQFPTAIHSQPLNHELVRAYSCFTGLRELRAFFFSFRPTTRRKRQGSIARKVGCKHGWNNKSKLQHIASGGKTLPLQVRSKKGTVRSNIAVQWWQKGMIVAILREIRMHIAQLVVLYERKKEHKQWNSHKKKP